MQQEVKKFFAATFSLSEESVWLEQTVKSSEVR